MFIRIVSSWRTCFFFRVMWDEMTLGSSAGTSTSMVPTLYGPVYVGNDRPGTQGLSRKPRGGRDFGFFAFGTFVVCSLPSTGCLEGRGILKMRSRATAPVYLKICKVLYLLDTRLILRQSGAATGTTPLCYLLEGGTHIWRTFVRSQMLMDAVDIYGHGRCYHSCGHSKDIHLIKLHSLRSGVAMLESSSRGTPREEGTLNNEVKL